MSDSAGVGERATAPVSIRRYMIDDPISEITALLHRAYAPQVTMGLRPLAGRQNDAVTLDRVMNSECYLAFQGATPGSDLEPDDSASRERLVGVVLLNEHEKAQFPAFFLRPDVSHFAMFAVEPALQGVGIGRALLGRCEQRARELGSRELALSMAEPDTALRVYYERRGYRFVEFWQWPYTNYRSCILSKPLA